MRYAGAFKLTINQDGGGAPPFLYDIGKKLLGELQRRLQLGAPPSLVQRVQLPSGVWVEARLINGYPKVYITPDEQPAGEMEEIIYAYMTSAAGLRVVDLGSKQVVLTVSGLAEYEVDDVTPDGQLVYLTGLYSPVRLDLASFSAFGYIYSVPALKLNGDVVTGNCQTNALRLSPALDRALIAFGTTYDPNTSQAIDGLGGFILADAETLAPLRSPLRMSYRPQAMAWSPDGERFFLGVSRATDPAGTPSLSVTTSTTDYIAVFDRNGVLLGTRLMASWGFTPDAGFARLVRALAVTPDGERLLAVVAPAVGSGEPYRLYALDATDPTLPVVDSLALGTTIANDVRVLEPGYGGKVALQFSADTIGEFSVSPLAEQHRTTSAAFTTAVASGPQEAGLRAIRNGPKSLVGAPPDDRQFVLDIDSGTLRGYRGFDNDAVYELDLSAFTVNKRFALAVTGVRPVQGPL